MSGSTYPLLAPTQYGAVQGLISRAEFIAQKQAIKDKADATLQVRKPLLSSTMALHPDSHSSLRKASL